jgi:hypothetical protein
VVFPDNLGEYVIVLNRLNAAMTRMTAVNRVVRVVFKFALRGLSNILMEMVPVMSGVEVVDKHLA